ncbi:MAG TPA: ADP-ribosylation factor-like protein [Dongiaceae bacterium]|nr:ADP-ribosylation factor-like protein [Dongiaceae bacterium]
MALINHRAREIHFKVVYYGPGLSGKTTNLRFLHDRLPPERRGRLISIATDHERTLFFDFLPIELGQISGMTTRFHLYTVPGQHYYQRSRRAVLQGVDAIVFVADSHPARDTQNRESLTDLHVNLAALGLSAEARRRLPWVVQYNKRDLPAALPLEHLRAALNPDGAPEFAAIANQGRGVNETLKAACKLALARLASDARPAAMPGPGAAPVSSVAAGPAPGPAPAAPR